MHIGPVDVVDVVAPKLVTGEVIVDGKPNFGFLLIFSTGFDQPLKLRQKSSPALKVRMSDRQLYLDQKLRYNYEFVLTSLSKFRGLRNNTAPLSEDARRIKCVIQIGV